MKKKKKKKPNKTNERTDKGNISPAITMRQMLLVLMQGKGSGTSMYVQSLRGDPFQVSFILLPILDSVSCNGDELLSNLLLLYVHVHGFF